MRFDGQPFNGRFKVEAIRYRILAALLVASILPERTLVDVVSGPDLTVTALSVFNQVNALKQQGLLRTHEFHGMRLVAIVTPRLLGHRSDGA